MATFIMAASLEPLRRAGREYDRKLVALARARTAQIQVAGLAKDEGSTACVISRAAPPPHHLN
jgi:hypothetical protein